MEGGREIIPDCWCCNMDWAGTKGQISAKNTQWRKRMFSMYGQ